MKVTSLIGILLKRVQKSNSCSHLYIKCRRILLGISNEAHCENSGNSCGNILRLDWFTAGICNSSELYLLPLYFIVSLGCYGLLMVGVGLMQFPTCPQEAVLLQKDIVEAKDFLKKNGVDIGHD